MIPSGGVWFPSRKDISLSSSSKILVSVTENERKFLLATIFLVRGMSQESSLSLSLSISIFPALFLSFLPFRHLSLNILFSGQVLTFNSLERTSFASGTPSPSNTTDTHRHAHAHSGLVSVWECGAFFSLFPFSIFFFLSIFISFLFFFLCSSFFLPFFLPFFLCFLLFPSSFEE